MSDFLKTFDSLEIPIQCRDEWLGFLEFCSAYFVHRGIERPVVLEVGTRLNLQKPFYERLLGAEHVGIDITDAEAKPDILGDSTAPATIQAVRDRLAGRPIDILFVDGNHEYEGVKRDFEIYGPMTRHILAFHDISIDFAGYGIRKLWTELRDKEAARFAFAAFESWTEPVLRLGCTTRIGIGIAVRRNPLEIG